MKNTILLLLHTILIIQVYGQSYTDKKGDVHLWGKVQVDDLLKEPYADWYFKNYDTYESDLNESDGHFLENTKVKVFLGTWCGDTKFLLPKFLKTWKQMNLSEVNVELIALHHEDDAYKQGPQKETIGYNIHKVPTFVFEKDGIEIGRIVERTVFDLDTDIMQIAKGNPYEERYQGVVILDKVMAELEDDSLFIKENLNKIYRSISREVSNSSELNAYGYVLKAQGQLKKAEFVFLLNKYLFPYEPNVRDSYGELLMAQEKWEEAKVEFEEVIRLKRSDENAVKQLHVIYSKIKESDISDQ